MVLLVDVAMVKTKETITRKAFQNDFPTLCQLFIDTAGISRADLKETDELHSPGSVEPPGD